MRKLTKERVLIISWAIGSNKTKINTTAWSAQSSSWSFSHIFRSINSRLHFKLNVLHLTVRESTSIFFWKSIFCKIIIKFCGVFFKIKLITFNTKLFECNSNHIIYKVMLYIHYVALFWSLQNILNRVHLKSMKRLEVLPWIYQKW